MDAKQYEHAIKILEEIQCHTNTQNETPSNYNQFKTHFDGFMNEEEIKKSYINFLKHLSEIELPTKYESAYYYDYLIKSLDLLDNEKYLIKISGRTLNYDKPIIGSANFEYFKAGALNQKGAKIILVSRSVIHFMCKLSSVVSKYYFNYEKDEITKELDMIFIDLSCSYCIFDDITYGIKNCICNTVEELNLASSLVITSYLFIVAHEYAHLMLEHNKISDEDVPFQKEMEADFLGGILSMKVIFNEQSNSYFTEGIVYILSVLDLLYDIKNIVKEAAWNPLKNKYPYPRIKILPEIFKYFDLNESGFTICADMWICVHNLWERNRIKIKEYLNLYQSFSEDKDAYKKLQDKIYSE